jgi:glycosyltransferase involved in cell wall biosynthesis
MRYRSRLEVLFDVAQRLPFRPKVLIIGSLDEHCRKVFAQILRDPSWKGYITHVDSVSPERLPMYYQLMDCLVHTVAGDSCPNVVVEALACGVPVVCPEDGGTSELVDNAGFAVQDPEGICGETMRNGMTKAILNILDDLPTFQRRARQRAENNNNIEILTSHYLEALGFPPYAYERGIKYRAVRAIGNIGSVLTPHIYVNKNNRPQVALVLWDWNLGGIASWMFRIAGAMPEYEFHFIATHLEQHASGCNQLGSFAYTPGFWKLRNYFIKRRIELVQVHNNRWPVDAAKAAGVRHIIERTDGTRSCCALSKRDLDYVIVSAAGTLPFIHSFWPNVRTEIIHNALDLSEVDRIDSRRIADPKFVSIGRCSRFGRGKRLDLLLDAVAILKHKGLPVHLVLAGEDSQLKGAISVEEELRNYALSLGDSVTFYGRTDEPLTLTKGFDIGVCSSDPFNEGIPNSLIEPMACGKPVVATNVDQVSELVQDGVNGFLVPPGNVTALAGAMEVLVCDPGLREKMGRAARRTIEERFSFDVALEKYKKVYASLLERD